MVGVIETYSVKVDAALQCTQEKAATHPFLYISPRPYAVTVSKEKHPVPPSGFCVLPVGLPYGFL
jgi:hypothetical protein